MSRPDDDDDVPRERLILVNVIEAFPSLHTPPLPPKPRAPPPPPPPLGKKTSSSSQRKSRGSFLRRVVFRVTLVSRFSVCVSLSLAENERVFFVEKVPSSSLFFCGAECTQRKKKDMGFRTFCVLVKRAKIMTLSCINRAETSFRVEIEQFLFVDEISARSKNV